MTPIQDAHGQARTCVKVWLARQLLTYTLASFFAVLGEQSRSYCQVSRTMVSSASRSLGWKVRNMISSFICSCLQSAFLDGFGEDDPLKKAAGHFAIRPLVAYNNPDSNCTVKGEFEMSFAAETFFTIGQFADLHEINKKTLMWYDEIGLLKPAAVRENGYRYYTYQQSSTLETILMLRNYRFPFVNSRVSQESLCGVPGDAADRERKGIGPHHNTPEKDQKDDVREAA